MNIHTYLIHDTEVSVCSTYWRQPMTVSLICTSDLYKYFLYTYADTWHTNTKVFVVVMSIQYI